MKWYRVALGTAPAHRVNVDPVHGCWLSLCRWSTDAGASVAQGPPRPTATATATATTRRAGMDNEYQSISEELFLVDAECPQCGQVGTVGVRIDAVLSITAGRSRWLINPDTGEVIV